VLLRVPTTGQERPVDARRTAMTRKNTTQKDSKVRLAVKKETLKDLSANKSVLGGFIMKDTVIIRTSGR